MTTAKTLRVLGIVVTVILVIVGCYWALVFAWIIAMKGGLTQRGMIFNPQAANGFLGTILAAIAIVTAGVLIIRKLAGGIVRGPAGSQFPATTPGRAAAARASAPASIPSSAPASRSVRTHLSTFGRKTIDRLVLALGAQIAVSAIMLFRFVSGPFVPRNWTLMLLPSFILSEAPYALLIYVLLKRPGRRAFTFLIAMLAIPILETLSNPVVHYSYVRIHFDHPMGLLLHVLSGLIYIVTIALAYKAMQQTGLRPKPSFVILATVATFFYFFFVREITPYLYGIWK
jgi:hypothetical protein